MENKNKIESTKDKTVETVRKEFQNVSSTMKEVKTLEDVKTLPLKLKAMVIGSFLLMFLFIFSIMPSEFDYQGNYVIDQSSYNKPQNIPDSRNKFSFTDNEITLMGDTEPYEITEKGSDYVHILIGKSGETQLKGQIVKTEKGVDLKLVNNATIVMHLKRAE
ncbi:hypothetical protein [Vibrio parahaemolyticus]|uniref:hypothetical protein n=1 Tax=Vibrio parahaemolyticus TaxID=670 RepID=UPI0004D7ED54|nr:hypothetical protein [Vibrio parahaemolyticus]OQT76747.1 hypothetical protein EM98_019455 [Vibrio parahaemolyticus]